MSKQGDSWARLAVARIEAEQADRDFRQACIALAVFFILGSGVALIFILAGSV